MKKNKLVVLLLALVSMGLYAQEKEEGKVILKKVGTEDEVETVLSVWRNLYEEKGIKSGFRVFSGFLGIEQPLYILTTWAEDPLDYHTKLLDAAALLGEEGAKLWEKMIGNVNGASAVEGWFLPQYSYAPGLKMAQ